jgi:hypothetical protein
MGGELELELDFDSASIVSASDVSSANGLQYPDTASLFEGPSSVPVDSPRVQQEEFVHLEEDEPAPITASDSFTSNASMTETSIQAHLANSTYGMLCDVIKGIEIKLDQDLPQVCASGSYAP